MCGAISVLFFATPILSDERGTAGRGLRGPASTGPARASRLGLAGIIAIAALLRFAFIGTKNLDVDEVTSLTYIRHGWTAFLAAVASDPNMALYYVILWPWARLGDSAVTLRSLSIIPAVATLPVVYALGHRLFDRRVGLIAVGLLSVNAYHIAYSQTARGYSLAVLLITLSSWFFARGIENRSWPDWAGYVLTSVLAIYSHLFSAFALLGQWGSLALFPVRHIPWKRLVVSGVLIASLSVPFLVLMVTRPQYQAEQLTWHLQGNLKDVIGLFYDLTGGADTRTALLRAPFGAYLLVCLIATADAAKLWASGKGSREGWYYGLLLGWLWIPILITTAIGLAVKPVFIRRYLLVCQPALVLLAAAGLSQIRPRWLLAAALAIFVSLGLYGTYHYYTDAPYDNAQDGGMALSRVTIADSGESVEPILAPRRSKMPPQAMHDLDRIGQPSIPLLGTQLHRHQTLRLPDT